MFSIFEILNIACSEVVFDKMTYEKQTFGARCIVYKD